MGTRKINPVRVSSEKEFERLLDHMIWEAHVASDHWQLLKNLECAASEYQPQMMQSRTFWNMTLQAHYDVTLFRLARLYDQHESSLSLRRLLATIKYNASFFSEEATRSRLRENPFVEGLLERKMNPAELDSDVQNVSDSDPLVAKLCGVRNSGLSHVEPNPIRLGIPTTRRWLEDSEIELLLDRAREVLNRWSLIYRATRMSGRVLGFDDFKRTLEVMRRGQDLTIAEHEAMVREVRGE